MGPVWATETDNAGALPVAARMSAAVSFYLLVAGALKCHFSPNPFLGFRACEPEPEPEPEKLDVATLFFLGSALATAIGVAVHYIFPCHTKHAVRLSGWQRNFGEWLESKPVVLVVVCVIVTDLACTAGTLAGGEGEWIEVAEYIGFRCLLFFFAEQYVAATNIRGRCCRALKAARVRVSAPFQSAPPARIRARLLQQPVVCARHDRCVYHGGGRAERGADRGPLSADQLGAAVEARRLPLRCAPRVQGGRRALRVTTRTNSSPSDLTHTRHGATESESGTLACTCVPRPRAPRMLSCSCSSLATRFVFRTLESRARGSRRLISYVVGSPPRRPLPQ